MSAPRTSLVKLHKGWTEATGICGEAYVSPAVPPALESLKERVALEESRPLVLQQASSPQTTVLCPRGMKLSLEHP